MLSEQTANLTVLAEALPRNIGTVAHRHQYLMRQLKNEALDVAEVMDGFIFELISSVTARGETAVIMMDQSKISDGMECLMLSLRVSNRAIPLLWEVIETRGAIGWEVQERLLSQLAGMLPLGTHIMLAADRFYGTAAFVRFAQAWGWGYRVRLKHNLTLTQEGGDITTGEAATMGMTALHDAELYGTGVITHIGILHEQGHPQPWVITMSEMPTKARTLDYGLRWGIEPMFSDFKSRGFGITDTRLQRPERVKRLILAMAIALILATFLGIQHKHTQKKKNA